MKIWLLNGPPRVGKDTLGGYLKMGLPQAYIHKFATEVKTRTHQLFGATEWGPGAYEGFKDTPHGDFEGATPRKAYIQFSEGFMKPLFGEDVFGHLLLQDLKRPSRAAENIIITDSGFAPEAQVLIDHYGIENIVLVQMHRDGCEFTGDSRDYITLPGVRQHTVTNNRSSVAWMSHAAELIEKENEHGS